MPYDFGDVVLVPFPFTSQTASKKRPAVVVSNRAYNDNLRRDIVVMAITSQLRPTGGAGEVWIVDWRSAGLLKPSAIKPVFATLEQTLVLRKLGTLAVGDRDALKKAIRQVLD
jgi:mRNA interferase MazF